MILLTLQRQDLHVFHNIRAKVTSWPILLENNLRQCDILEFEWNWECWSSDRLIKMIVTLKINIITLML